MAIPELTMEERMKALGKAAQARHDRAELLKKFKRGELDPVGYLDLDHGEGDTLFGRTKVEAFITAQPGYGKAKAQKLMREIGISPSRRIKGLGARQREALREALRGARTKAQKRA